MPRKLVPVVVIAALVLLLLGFGGGRPGAVVTAQPAKAVAHGDAIRGRAVFQGTCAFCHGANARGMKGFGKDLVNQSDWMKRQDDAALIAFIKTGRSATDPLNESGYDMLPLGGNPTLTETDVTDVVAYIRTLQQK